MFLWAYCSIPILAFNVAKPFLFYCWEGCTRTVVDLRINKALIKRGASHRKFWLVMACEANDQTIRKFLRRFAMPFARVRVILQCYNIKIYKTRDYWTRDYVFHGNWSPKIILFKLAFFVQSYRKCLKSLKKLGMTFEPAQIVRKSSQVVGQTRHKSTQVKTCDDFRSRLIRP